MSPLRAATTGATTASASFSSAIGTPNLPIRVRAPANTINRCNSAGGKTRHAGRCRTNAKFCVIGKQKKLENNKSKDAVANLLTVRHSGDIDQGAIGRLFLHRCINLNVIGRVGRKAY
jgi:hypothetical protein